MKRLILGVLSTLTFATLAQASTCGTIASPGSCTLSAGNILYTVTDFSLITANGAGGGNTYQGGDINIDIATGGGSTLLMSFSKNSNGPTPGIVFFANAGNTSTFTVQYQIAISALAPGSVSFLAPATVALATSSASGNGFSQVQMILSGAPGTSCSAVRNSVNVTQDDCALPGGLGTTLVLGDLMTLSGNTGNTSIGTYTNLFDASFTASEVPEPSSFLLMAVGVGAMVAKARSTRRS